jgi:hypothetical protein
VTISKRRVERDAGVPLQDGSDTELNDPVAELNGPVSAQNRLFSLF